MLVIGEGDDRIAALLVLLLDPLGGRRAVRVRRVAMQICLVKPFIFVEQYSHSNSPFCRVGTAVLLHYSTTASAKNQHLCAKNDEKGQSGRHASQYSRKFYSPFSEISK